MMRYEIWSAQHDLNPSSAKERPHTLAIQVPKFKVYLTLFKPTENNYVQEFF
jgi:hypothetical protein